MDTTAPNGLIWLSGRLRLKLLDLLRFWPSAKPNLIAVKRCEHLLADGARIRMEEGGNIREEAPCPASHPTDLSRFLCRSNPEESPCLAPCPLDRSRFRPGNKAGGAQFSSSVRRCGI